MSSDGKKVWRDRWRAAYPRDAAQRQALSDRICARLLRLEEFHRSRHVGLFSPLPWEPDLTALWLARPDACAYPKAEGPARRIAFFRIASPDELEPGYAGIREPRPDPARQVSDWGPRDLILVPGSAFDRFGGRIGSGLGFYDRFLASCPAQRLAIAFDAQVTTERLAQEPTDARMGGLCTESAVSWFSSP